MPLQKGEILLKTIYGSLIIKRYHVHVLYKLRPRLHNTYLKLVFTISSIITILLV